MLCTKVYWVCFKLEYYLQSLSLFEIALIKPTDPSHCFGVLWCLMRFFQWHNWLLIEIYHECSSKHRIQFELIQGFDNAIYGIIFISKTFMKTGFSRDDLEYLSDILLMENQVMHALWYYVTNTEVSEWYPRLAMNIAMRFPPETVDSISRKFQVKFAGSYRYRCDV